MATVSKQKVFGSGHVVYVPDITATNATPVPILTLQEVTLTMKGTTKKLMGENRVAEDIALAELDVSGKYKSGTIRSGLFAAALPGSTVTQGSMVRGIWQETTGVIAGATYTTSKTTSVVVLSVYDENGKVMQPLPSTGTPAAGQYKVTTGGVFAFHASATTKTYAVDYLYTDATGGYTVDFSNQLTGTSATMVMYMDDISRGREFGAKLYAVTIPELSLALKNGEFMMPEGTFEAFADSSGKIVSFYGED